jgi:bifunctional non-homologous end joining protein LigD
MTAIGLSCAGTVPQCGFTAATVRLAAIAATAELMKAKSFTIDREAVVLGPDGLSRFEELSHRQAARIAILYAFDLIEHDGEDMRNLPCLGGKAALG